MNAGRVTLRPPTLADLPLIQALWRDPRTMEAVGGPVPVTDAWMQTWFERMVDPGGPTNRYRLILDGTGTVVGEVSFHRMDEARMSAGLNLKVADDKRRRGYAREALDVFLREFFDELDGREMTDDLALGNEGGRRLLVGFGFEHDPTVEGVHFLRLSREAYQTRQRKNGTSA